MALVDDERRASRDRAWDRIAYEIVNMTQQLEEIRTGNDLSDANARVKSRLDDLRTELNEWPGMTRVMTNRTTGDKR